MGFFNKIFGGGGNEGKKETSADRMLRIIREKTTTACVKLIPEPGETRPWESKIGGMTGDTLGAGSEVIEILFYAMCVAATMLNIIK